MNLSKRAFSPNEVQYLKELLWFSGQNITTVIHLFLFCYVCRTAASSFFPSLVGLLGWSAGKIPQRCLVSIFSAV